MDDLLNRRLFEWSKKMILKIRPLRRLALRTRDEITQSYIEQIAELENQIELMQAQSIYLKFCPTWSLLFNHTKRE